MSKLDYGCVVLSPLPEYQMKWLQSVQTTCAGYVLGRYAVLENLQQLNRLPIIKRRHLALRKITQKPFTMMFGLITNALNSILSVAIT